MSLPRDPLLWGMTSSGGEATRSSADLLAALTSSAVALIWSAAWIRICEICHVPAAERMALLYATVSQVTALLKLVSASSPPFSQPTTDETIQSSRALRPSGSAH